MEKKLKYVDICEDLRGQILEAKIHPGDRPRTNCRRSMA
mgnify:CR=1 FL=1